MKLLAVMKGIANIYATVQLLKKNVQEFSYEVRQEDIDTISYCENGDRLRSPISHTRRAEACRNTYC